MVNKYNYLYIEKGPYDQDAKKDALLDKFNNELIYYIARSIDSFFLGNDKGTTLNDIRACLIRDNLDQKSQLTPLARHALNGEYGPVVISDIWFPCAREQDNQNHEKILDRLAKVEFRNCKFSDSTLPSKRPDLLFVDCEFINEKLNVYPVSMLDNPKQCMFWRCSFNGHVAIIPSETHSRDFSCGFFHNCVFDFGIEVNGCHVEGVLFNDSSTKNSPVNLKYAKIIQSDIKSRFILNGYNVNRVELVDSVFSDKFELKSGIVEAMEIGNSNFHGITDFHDSEFNKSQIVIQRCIFEEFTGFEHCTFNTSVIFQYVTFKSQINFRHTKFFGGLSLETANFTVKPNFLGIHVESRGTDRETYTIIKDSFESRGNIFDADRYYAEEMRCFMESADTSKRDRIVLFFNNILSEFGSNYWLPLIWLSSVLFLFSAVRFAARILLPEGTEEITCGLLGYTMMFLNDLCKGFIPFNRFLEPKMEFISLIFYVIILTLTWQFIISIKRRTRRK